MTTIGSTPYYTSNTRYAGADKANSAYSDAAQVGAVGQQDDDNKAAKPASTGPSSLSATVNGAPSTVTLDFQGKLFTLTRLDASNLKPINVAELPDDQYQAFIEGEEHALEANRRYLESQHTDRSSTDTVEGSLKKFPLSDYPQTKPYATVEVGGQVVATIDNQGVVTSDDALGEKIRDILKNLDGKSGPDLAQKTAEQIANLVGGRVNKASTAMAQGDFDALPAIERPSLTVDTEGMKNDPMYAQLQKMYENLQTMKEQRETFMGQKQAGIDIAV